MLDQKIFDLDEVELLEDLQDGIISEAEYKKAIRELKKYYRDLSKVTDKREEDIYD